MFTSNLPSFGTSLLLSGKMVAVLGSAAALLLVATSILPAAFAANLNHGLGAIGTKITGPIELE